MDMTVQGIVLSSMPIGEYDRRLEILTAEVGRISVFARSSRKPSSPLVSCSRSFAFGTFRLIQGRSSYSLISADIRNYFTELTKDVELTYYGSYFLELCRYFSRENLPAEDMLLLIYRSLKALSLNSLSRSLVRRVYELKMLDINGLCPPADRMLAGQGQFAFAADLNTGAAYAIRFVIESSIEKIYTFTLSDESFKAFSDIVARLMAMSVDRRFKSIELLENP